jgi:transcriptional antiterminator Rof (Rho-off)
MADPDIVEIACARAWSVYLLINSGIKENDARHDMLKRFIRTRWEAGGRETEYLAVEGLKYLKTLDGSPTA